MLQLAGHGSKEVIIASGQSISPYVGLSGHCLMAIQMPSAWTAASLTFSVSHNGRDWADLYTDDGTEVSITVDAGRYVVLDPATFAGAEFLKVRSGTSTVAVNQGANRTLVLITGKVLD